MCVYPPDDHFGRPQIRPCVALPVCLSELGCMHANLQPPIVSLLWGDAATSDAAATHPAARHWHAGRPNACESTQAALMETSAAELLREESAVELVHRVQQYVEKTPIFLTKLLIFRGWSRLGAA